MGRGTEGILGLEDVGWEMRLEDFETPAIGGWIRGLAGFYSSLRGHLGLGNVEGAGPLTQYGDVEVF